jgi:hypothetical protein
MLTPPALSMADWTPLDADGQFEGGHERRQRRQMSEGPYPNHAV